MCVRFVRGEGEMCVRFVPGWDGGLYIYTVGTDLPSTSRRRSPGRTTPLRAAAPPAGSCLTYKPPSLPSFGRTNEITGLSAASKESALRREKAGANTPRQGRWAARGRGRGTARGGATAPLLVRRRQSSAGAAGRVLHLEDDPWAALLLELLRRAAFAGRASLLAGAGGVRRLVRRTCPVPGTARAERRGRTVVHRASQSVPAAAGPSPERGAGAHGRGGVELSGDLPPESMSPG